MRSTLQYTEWSENAYLLLYELVPRPDGADALDRDAAGLCVCVCTRATACLGGQVRARRAEAEYGSGDANTKL